MNTASLYKNRAIRYKTTSCSLVEKKVSEKMSSLVQVELLDRNGEIVHLTELEQSVDPVSTLLKGRQSYIVLSVSRECISLPI